MVAHVDRSELGSGSRCFGWIHAFINILFPLAAGVYSCDDSIYDSVTFHVSPELMARLSWSAVPHGCSASFSTQSVAMSVQV